MTLYDPKLRALCEGATAYFSENPQKHPNVNGHFNALIMGAEAIPTLLDKLDEVERVMGVMAEHIDEIKVSIASSQKPDFNTKNWLLNADLCCDLALKEHAKLMGEDDGSR